MGPYFLSTLINLLGPVRRVCASATSTWSERTITTRARFGETVKVGTPTHLAGVLDFESGVVATLVTSFDVWWVEGPSIEVFGTEGSLQVPHPNMFGGTVRMRMREEAVHEMPLTYQYAEDSRGIGLADMAEAIAEGRPHRANAEVAFHVLEIMEAYLQSDREGRHVEITSRCERPQAMEPGLGPAIVPGL